MVLILVALAVLILPQRVAQPITGDSPSSSFVREPIQTACGGAGPSAEGFGTATVQ